MDKLSAQLIQSKRDQNRMKNEDQISPKYATTFLNRITKHFLAHKVNHFEQKKNTKKSPHPQKGQIKSPLYIWRYYLTFSIKLNQTKLASE